MNNDDLLDKIGKLIDTKLEPLQAGQARLEKGQARLEHDQQEQGKQLDTLLLGQAHTNTAIEALENKIDATKTELRREIKERQKPQHAD